MGNSDLVVIINGWYALLVLGQNYDSERDALEWVQKQYYKCKEYAEDSPDRDFDFDWTVRNITICILSHADSGIV